MDFTGWSPGHIAYQLQIQQEASDDLSALVEAGLPWETAKRVARYNETYDDIDLRDFLRLRVSRSEARVNSQVLKFAQLDVGLLYAVFIPDIPELGIQSITFRLDGVPVHTESSDPWDYAGTTPGGDSTRVTFTAGAHIIDADVTDVNGIFSISAEFNVE